MEILSWLGFRSKGVKRIEQPDLNPSEDPVINSLALERNYALLTLMYLLPRSPGSMTHSQVESLAYQLYVDARRAKVRPLYKVALAAELFPEGSRLKKSPFLNHVALKYKCEEMERDYNELDPTKKYHDLEDEGTIADTLAGGGPPRPLLKELYSFHAQGVVNCVKKPDRETFYLTDLGSQLAEAINFSFTAGVEFHGKNFLIAVGGYWDKGETLPLSAQS